ncbi:MAG: cytochrome P450 [Rhodospirillaceae bacterium]|nr:cytochrome P450 [Rhodospirillaceae bacterium]MBT4688347.1 cytochrome P450 [Rhodospirillaceae bacterium]MBT5080059.1 cytochrome P450 [Rhodospirillaceae bacterium]MBT5525648.1 cytochrome P450 [Rhodospirillaceae bacterium]MBT5880407.1 cytochrome P450 [Rhodospirillaceae bacterium]
MTITPGNSSGEIDVSDFDLMDLPADYVPNAHSYFAALRQASPIHRNRDGSYILTRYDDLVTAYRDPRVWSSDKKAAFGPKFGTSPLFEHHTTSLVFVDPPDHTRIRKLFQSAFTRKSLAALEPRIHALVDGYLDELADGGEMEFVSGFSFRLPVEIVCDMLGVPTSDRLLIREWALSILGALEPVMTDQQFQDGCAAVDNFKAYLRDRVKERKANPDGGRDGEILTALIEAEEEGEKLTEIELLHQCIFLLNAGHETSTNMISHGAHEMLRHPGEIEKLRADATLIDSMVEEVLRFQAPIQINNRRALHDTKLSGTAIPAGSVVHLMIGAANLDPAQFPDPECFDITRRPNRHLSFGLGIHICAGNALARMEAKIAFAKLFQRFPNLRLVAPAALSDRIRFREVTELKVAI